MEAFLEEEDLKVELCRKHIPSNWTLVFSLDFSVGETLEVA